MGIIITDALFTIHLLTVIETSLGGVGACQLDMPPDQNACQT